MPRDVADWSIRDQARWWRAGREVLEDEEAVPSVTDPERELSSGDEAGSTHVRSGSAGDGANWSPIQEAENTEPGSRLSESRLHQDSSLARSRSLGSPATERRRISAVQEGIRLVAMRLRAGERG